MNDSIPQDPQLLEGDQQRCACVLLLDTSGSMSGTPIDELNKGLRIFQEELQADPLSRKRVDVAVVSFDSVVTPVQPFINATQFKAPTLSAQGGTEMAGGISKALELVANRKIEYRSAGIVPYRPWIFMITDGQASGLDGIETQLRAEEERKGVVFFAVGVQGADMECLRRLAGDKKTFELKGLNFRGLFSWLSASLKKASAGSPGLQQALDKPDNTIII
jgi:uncharacterized protein YegL